MIIVYLFLLALVLYKIRFLNFNEEYLSFDSTNSIKGICILLVFISHLYGYLGEASYDFDGIGDSAFLFVQKYVSQWIVAMFLFYSGYGIMESAKKKGRDYINHIPSKRFMTVLLNFDVAVLFFLGLNLILGNELSCEKVVLSLVCWDDLGNSNWYILAILLCYAGVYFAFRLASYKIKQGLYLSCLLIAFMMIVLYVVKEPWWYDTIMCFPFGMIFSYYKKSLESVMRSHYLVFFLMGMGAFLVGKKLIVINPMMYNVAAMGFVVCVLTLTMKCSIKNSVLVWLGKNLFPLYIYQRIPMIIFSETVLIRDYPLVYWVVCFVLTVLIAYFYKYWQLKLK